MAQQNQQLSPELIKILLGTNITAEEAMALKQQQQAQALGKAATAYTPRSGSAAGGAMGALAQGLQGYQSGKLDKTAETDMLRLGKTRADNRQTWFNQIYPQQTKPPVIQSPMLAPEEDYLDWDS
jgi:hypothetical protein